MKFKLWKATTVSAIAIATVITLPVVLIACSSTEDTGNYRPASSIKEKFTLEDYEILNKGWLTMTAPEQKTELLPAKIIDYNLSFSYKILASEDGSYNAGDIIETCYVLSFPYKVEIRVNNTIQQSIDSPIDHIKDNVGEIYKRGLEDPTSENYRPSAAVKEKFPFKDYQILNKGWLTLTAPDKSAELLPARVIGDNLLLAYEVLLDQGYYNAGDIMETRYVLSYPHRKELRVNDQVEQSTNLTIDSLKEEIYRFYEKGLEDPASENYRPSAAVKEKISFENYQILNKGWLSSQSETTDFELLPARIIGNNLSFSYEILASEDYSYNVGNTIEICYALSSPHIKVFRMNDKIQQFTYLTIDHLKQAISAVYEKGGQTELDFKTINFLK